MQEEIRELKEWGNGSSSHKMWKTNMPSSFMKTNKAHKIKDFFVNLELYFKAQPTPKNDKVTIAIAIHKEHTFL